ncbi:MAG: hypothetical protein HZB19_14025 [Chloroflexi bacterium]|nr:hypothetical protein [Chloroflexota bacterium]
MILWLASDSVKFTRHIKGLKEKKKTSSIQNRDFTRDELNDLKRKFSKQTEGLKFAYEFSAQSFLVGLVAPALAAPISKNIGLLVVFGVLLFSGIYCFIEAMQLGGFLTTMRLGSKAWIWLFEIIILPAYFWYLLFGLAGYGLYSFLPNLVSGSDELTQLLRVINKAIAGAFVILAAYLVAWHLAGLADRLKKMLITVSLCPLLLPVYKVISSYLVSGDLQFVENRLEIGSDVLSIVYAILLVGLPFLMFKYGSTPSGAPSEQKSGSIAYIKNISWIPFAIGGVEQRYKSIKGYRTAYELIEEVVGQTVSGDNRSAFSFIPAKVWHSIARTFGSHKDFDVIVIDLDNALRLLDAFHRQDRKYTLVAGVCRRKDAVLEAKVLSESEKKIVVFSGEPSALDLSIRKRIKGEPNSVFGNADFFTLPPNCIIDYFPEVANMVVAPEPFGADIRLKKKASVNECALNPYDSMHYEVVLVKNYDRASTQPITDVLVRGINLLHSVYPNTPHEWADILQRYLVDGDEENNLDRHAVMWSIGGLDLEKTLVISPTRSGGKQNWDYLRERLALFQDFLAIKEDDIRVDSDEIVNSILHYSTQP